MLYEISNPSDPYTMDAPDLAVAAVAVILLGQGRYGLQTEAWETAVPIFLLGGADGWCQERFGKTPQELYDTTDPIQVADCLDSVVIGGFRDRQDYLSALSLIEAPERKQQWQAEWHDRRRSSLNDIGGRARAMATALRLKGGSE